MSKNISIKYWHLLITAIILVILAFVLAYNSVPISNKVNYAHKMQRVFIEKCEQVQEYFKHSHETDFESFIEETKDAEKEGISILVFEDGELIYWSDNNVPYNFIVADSIIDGKVIQLSTRLYYPIRDTFKTREYLGLILLESNYPYQNNFLKNGVHTDFKVPHGYLKVDRDNKNGSPVFNPMGKYAFSLYLKDYRADYITIFSKISTLMLFIGIFFLFAYFRQFILNAESDKKQFRILLVVAILFIIRFLLFFTKGLNDRFYLFDPFLYATKSSPSFGDLLVNTFLFSFLCYLLYRFIVIPTRFAGNKFNRTAWNTILNILFILVLFYAQNISLGLIKNSSISIVMHNISQVSLASILSYLVFAANYFSVLLVGIWLFKNLSNEKKYVLIINFTSLLLVFYLLNFAFHWSFDGYTLLFAFTLYVLIALFKNKIYNRTVFSSLVLFLLLFSIYVLFFTVHFTNIKENQHNQSYAVNLSNEHDPIAEYLFADVTEEIKTDTIIENIFLADAFDILKLYNYLSKNTLSGYWKKYNIIITVCGESDSVVIGSPNVDWYPCYEHFENYIKDLGMKIQGVPFYYMDNNTGLISYLGWMKFKNKESDEISLFIELETSFTADLLGYPELLLDERFQYDDFGPRISYAKYNNGMLISHSGEYEYSLISKSFEKNTEARFYTEKINGFNHLVYKPDSTSIIVISEADVKTIDLIVLFSYIFVFYYLVSLFVVFVVLSGFRKISFRDSLKNKIQFSIISILLVSLILIAGSSIWFNIRKYNQTQDRILKEKIQSVYIELDHKLAYEEFLFSNWSTDRYENLDELLIKFSEVFYSDINLYDPEGYLLATSRPEIFNTYLQNDKMHPQAYFKLHTEKLARYVHKENINNLSYLSAYVPFVNTEGKLLAYLNLPYFTKQRELQEDLTTLTVAIVNIYVLLIFITILVAVFISNQITKPLEMLQERFRDLSLGGRYEQIKYNRQDEIGKLVYEYNNMVTELEQSIELLAKSEREMAWREMAKQVAHEIKNPLTPMRLSVQHLLRAWDDKKENFDSYLKRVAMTLIEQIDNLSTIAGEFSNFAKMPIANIQKVYLTEVLQKSVSLFDGHDKVDTILTIKNDNLYAEADSEQLLRVFINLIKNGIQAMPDNKKGIIKVKLEKKENYARISISDNGKGIPDEIRNKLFMPNFTTKSSGMGLGLAIVQNILEQFNSTIDFRTEMGVGTTFMINIPLIS